MNMQSISVDDAPISSEPLPPPRARPSAPQFEAVQAEQQEQLPFANYNSSSLAQYAPTRSVSQPAGSYGHKQIGQQLSQYRPMARELRQYIDALAGPSTRQPLVYNGDPIASLDRLHQDVVTQYMNLSSTLGDHVRQDLMLEPETLGGMGYGRLSLAPPPLNYPLSSTHLRSLGGSFLSPSGGQSNMISGGSYLQNSGVAYHSGSRHPMVPAGGLRPSMQSAPAGHTGGALMMYPQGSAGIRASEFTFETANNAPDSLLGGASSQLLYPPIGSTFDGHPSRTVEALRRGGCGIDTLSDLNYRRKQPLQYDDLLKGGEGMDTLKSLPRSQNRSERDQLDTFLADFVMGKVKAPELAPSFALSRSQRGYL